MDHFQEAVSEVARSTAEAQLKVIENSIAAMVRREIAAVAAGGPLPPLRSQGSDSSLSRTSFGRRMAAENFGPFGMPPEAAWPSDELAEVPCAPIIRADALVDCPRVLNNLSPPDTIWQASMLAGMPIMGSVGTAVLLLSFVSSFCMQAYVALTLSKGFLWDSSKADRQLADMVNSPSAVYANATVLSLVAPSGLEKAGPETPGGAQNVDAISSRNPGPLLCFLAVVIWMLSVARDLSHTLGFASAMLALPRKATHLTRTADMYALVSVSTGRLVFAMTIASVRLAVALLLLAVGSKRLASARSPLELALTAAALGFALDVPRRAWSWGAAAQRLGRASWNWYNKI